MEEKVTQADIYVTLLSEKQALLAGLRGAMAIHAEAFPGYGDATLTGWYMRFQLWHLL